jgi:hypothetical protein
MKMSAETKAKQRFGRKGQGLKPSGVLELCGTTKVLP